jgi:hypothetical protein
MISEVVSGIPFFLRLAVTTRFSTSQNSIKQSNRGEASTLRETIPIARSSVDRIPAVSLLNGYNKIAMLSIRRDDFSSFENTNLYQLKVIVMLMEPSSEDQHAAIRPLLVSHCRCELFVVSWRLKSKHRLPQEGKASSSFEHA